MKLLRAALPLIILAALAAPCSAQSGRPSDGPPPPVAEYNPGAWKEFTSAEGGFSIHMPGTPKAETVEIDSPPGKVSFRTFGLKTDAGTYDVSYSDLPIYSEDPAHIDKGLDANRDELLKNTGLKLLGEKAISFEGVPAREWLLVGSEGVIRRRLIIVKDRLYALTFVTSPRVAFNSGRPSAEPSARTDFYEATAAKFFDSFKVTRRSAAATARRVEDEQAARGRAPEHDGATILPPRGAGAASEGSKAEGEVDRLISELPEKGETVYGRCAEGADCKPVAGSTLELGEPLSRPEPAYPAIARAARAQGEVRVLVVVDEEGKVIAAQAASGHPLLQLAALRAARQALFKPALLDGKPVKISGVLSYNFVLQQ